MPPLFYSTKQDAQEGALGRSALTPGPANPGRMRLDGATSAPLELVWKR